MSAKKRQTFGKMNRERAVKEKRARKQEKKERRKLGTLAGVDAEGAREDGPSVETQPPTP